MKESDIIKLTPTQEDLKAGAEYAAITLPWTFNRMMENTGSIGQQMRGLRIAKGIVAQEMLRRKFEELDISPELERKSYRNDDLFDFKVPISGVYSKLDIKTINYYTDYPNLGREPLSKKLIVSNQSYFGADWRMFFPMLVPHTQIGQDKEVYCFGITSSIDYRKDHFKNRNDFAITAFPFGEYLSFCSSSKLCLAREQAKKGIYLSVGYYDDSLFGENILFNILGEWDGKKVQYELDLAVNKKSKIIGPFSCVSSFQTDYKSFQHLSGKIELRISKNEFTVPILNSLRRNTNEPPESVMILHSSDFCNLVLPNDYTLYLIGWITKTDFLKAVRKYVGWVWPKDSINKFHNQQWSQITEKDLKSLVKAGFDDTVQRKPSLIKSGWMKTNGGGGGACCYVYPNIGRNGGVKETNLYVLPQDLNPIHTLR